MLFGDADIEETIGKFFGKCGQTGAVRHGGRNRHDPLVFSSQFAECRAEDGGVGGRPPLPLRTLAGLDIERSDAVKQ